MKIELPWPSSVLSPNTPGHWSAKCKPKAKHKSDCFFAAKAQGDVPVFSDGNIPLSIVFHPPSKRGRRDLDNLLARMKSGLDGLATAWRIDDSRFRPITIDIGEFVPHGKVVVEARQ